MRRDCERSDTGSGVMFCPRCGKKVPDRCSFCLWCGSELIAAREYMQRYMSDPPFGGRPPESAEAPAENPIKSGKLQLDTLVYPDLPVLTFRDKAEWAVDRGNNQYRQEHYWEAIQCYDHALAQDPDYARAWNNKGLALTKLGRLDEARVCLEHLRRIRGQQSLVKRLEPDPEERFVGGFSSLSLKRLDGGMIGNVAGLLGSGTGGYGVYISNKRLFVIKNRKLDITHPHGVSFGHFLKEELFGGTIEESPMTLSELEINKLFDAHVNEIVSIEVKRPILLSGACTIITSNGRIFRLFIDHAAEYRYILELMKSFCPERVKKI
jgi:tetratricopeptide (TPR) repeat protein